MSVELSLIEDGRPKSGRTWKKKQTQRFSSQKRAGVLSHLGKSFEVKDRMRKEREQMKALEAELRANSKALKVAEIAKKEERKKQKMENEFKSSSYQVINPSKMKSMSKKQLRMVKKTAMNKNGQVELVNIFGTTSKK